jgi:hypothetical protein
VARALLGAPARDGTPSSTSIDEALAPQWVTLLGVSYVFWNEAAVALSASYTLEGDGQHQTARLDPVRGERTPRRARQRLRRLSPLRSMSPARELFLEPSPLRLWSQPERHDRLHVHVHLVLVVTSARRVALLFALLATSGACQSGRAALEAPVPRLVLAGTDGASHDLADEARSARLTVLFFSAWSCPCQTRARRAHSRAGTRAITPSASTCSPSTPRWAVLCARQGGSDAARLRLSGARRWRGALARALGAEYATESFVLDAGGRRPLSRRARLGSQTSFTTTRCPYLTRRARRFARGEVALRTAESKALGCASADVVSLSRPRAAVSRQGQRILIRRNSGSEHGEEVREASIGSLRRLAAKLSPSFLSGAFLRRLMPSCGRWRGRLRR